ncbi:MAG: NAD(P)/FAD-dependent oxidoreductase [Aureispira sp.]
MESVFDVIIIGGSYAGLSAAMTLGRSMRQVLVIDTNKACNRFAPHSHNFITQDGQAPAAIAQAARVQVLAYPTVELVQGLAVAARGADGAFEIEIETGLVYKAKKLLFTTGLRDLLPAIEGLKECWGKSVIHCPYCHGYEVRGVPTGILMNDERVIDVARLIGHWSTDLTIYTNGIAQFDLAQLPPTVRVFEAPIHALVHQEGQLEAITFENGESCGVEALYYRPVSEQHCSLPEKLGCTLTEAGHLEVDVFQQTTVAGILAAGDCATYFRAVSVAVAEGTKAGATLNRQLLA